MAPTGPWAWLPQAPLRPLPSHLPPFLVCWVGAVTHMLWHRILGSYVTPGVRSYLAGLSSGSLAWEQCRPTAPGVAGRSRRRQEGKGLLEGSCLPRHFW